jgi:hypothetical protein
MRAVVDPPFIVRRRAWECSYVLHEEFFGRLPIEHRVRVVVLRTGPDGLGWYDCGAMFVLFGAVVDVRV